MTDAENLLEQEVALRAKFKELFPDESDVVTLSVIAYRLRLQELQTNAIASRFSETANDTQRIMNITKDKFGVGREVGEPSKSSPNQG
ncbi:hypothetical protein KBD69_03375 [Candidatus Woesebacteria bacterium]|nr:hypothetical protein [Candidatus Woesebacteria bacterium]